MARDRAKVRAWHRQAYARDPHRYRASAKRWRATNLEKAKAQGRARRAAKAEQFRERDRLYYAANRERILAQRKVRRDAKPEETRKQHNAYKRRWYAANAEREQAKACWRRYLRKCRRSRVAPMTRAEFDRGRRPKQLDLFKHGPKGSKPCPAPAR